MGGRCTSPATPPCQAQQGTHYREEQPGEVFSEEAKRTWSVLAASFTGSSSFTVLPQKKKRIVAYHELQAIDNMVQLVAPTGLKTFLPQDSDGTKPLLELPTLVTNEDSGPIPWATRNFRLYKLRLRELPARGVST